MINCSFLRPIIWAVYRNQFAGPVNIQECSIDFSSMSKAYVISPADRYNFPTHILQNSFGGKSGLIYSNGEVISDYSTIHGTGPSIRVQLVTDFYKKATDVKIGLVYTLANTAKTFSVYIKATSGWVGVITPTIRLNGKIIKSFSDITTIPTDWTQYTYSCSTGEVTSEGELSLVYRVSIANNLSFWVDDLAVS